LNDTINEDGEEIEDEDEGEFIDINQYLEKENEIIEQATDNEEEIQDTNNENDEINEENEIDEVDDNAIEDEV
jgi:hypothetical protein